MAEVDETERLRNHRSLYSKKSVWHRAYPSKGVRLAVLEAMELRNNPPAAVVLPFSPKGAA